MRIQMTMGIEKSRGQKWDAGVVDDKYLSTNTTLIKRGGKKEGGFIRNKHGNFAKKR